MKKFLPSLILLFTLFAFGTKAQIVSPCNPQFGTQFLSGALVKFNPAITTDSPYVYHSWQFGDGGYSNAISPAHLYATGVYTVKHFLYRNTSNWTFVCMDSAIQTVTIIQGACNLSANFYSGYDYYNPYIRHYYNNTFPANQGDSIRWTFGDGTSSNQQDPTHTFPASGIYNVCLRVIKQGTLGTAAPCISEFCRPDTIVIPAVYPCNIQTNFSYAADPGNQQLIHFTNQSLGYLASDTLRWTFGDGTSSTQVNPDHTYANGGNYIVCLTLSRPSAQGLPPCVQQYCSSVTIAQPCNLAASFVSYRDSTVSTPNSYHFTNTSINASTADSIRWTFGDGTSSNQMNPNHAYAQPGSYNVCLRIIKRTATGALTNCISEICHSVVVPQPVPMPSCTQLSAYQFSNSAANAAIVNFTPNYINNAVQYTWTFGDGTGSQSPTATHQYAASGYYTACLTTYANNNCASTTCRSVYVAPNCNNITLGFTETPDSLVPNRIRFTGTSNTFMPNQRWTITKVPANGTNGTATIYQNNPTYVFLDSGYYNVCLRVTFANGCVKDYCRIIHIAHSMPGTSSCVLQVYPNPASTVINAAVTLAQPLILNAYVYNSMNMLVAQKQQQGVVGNNTVSISIATLPAGVYSVRLYYGNDLCTSTFIKL